MGPFRNLMLVLHLSATRAWSFALVVIWSALFRVQAGFLPAELFYIRVFESCHDRVCLVFCIRWLCIACAFFIAILSALSFPGSLQRPCFVLLHVNCLVCVVYYVHIYWVFMQILLYAKLAYKTCWFKKSLCEVCNNAIIAKQCERKRHITGSKSTQIRIRKFLHAHECNTKF